TIAQQTDAMAADHFAWLLAKGIQPATVNSSYRSPWFAVWRAAHRAGLIATEPKIKKLREPRSAPDAWSLDEFRAIVNATADFMPGKCYGRIPCGPWWRAMLLTAWYTGLRRAALFAIRRSDVNLATGWVSVPPEFMK